MYRVATCFALSALACVLIPSGALAGGDEWLNFGQETSSRLVVASGLGATDTEEKDYAWGDVDQDGDDDVVVVRKQPFTTSGGRRNVLFMNEDGVLVDRTNDYAVASNDGTQGFLDATNDRDVQLVDVNGDTWLDIVTATACNGCGGSKSITHPRIYINQGLIDDAWAGFIYEEERIPQFSINPNFCGVGVGDVTGDDRPELHFTDYNSNLEDRLLINDGNGFFTDESEVRMTAAMLASSFGTNSVMVDVNDDLIPDIIKSENGPIETLYNDGGGIFTQLQSTYGGAAYAFNTGDLNNDGLVDIAVGDDGSDRYLLNNGPGGNGLATFSNNSFSWPPGESDEGFSGNSLIVDFDKDGWNDVIMTDVDVDAGGCGRHTNFYHNMGGTVGGFVSLVSDTPGGMTEFILTGTHDAAVLDIDGDGFLDVVMGRCTGTEVWMNQPPFGVEFEFPEPLPELIDPDVPAMLRIELVPVGEATPIPSETKMVYRINGDAFTTVTMNDIGGGVFEILSPDMDCLDGFEFYFSAALEEGGSFTSPPFAPAQLYGATVALGIAETYRDSLEDDFDWVVINDPALQTGAWEQAEPIGTLVGGDIAAPFEDAESEPGHVKAAVTKNCPAPGCVASSYDVDGGPTDLISPLINLAGADGYIRTSLWFFTQGHEDWFEISVSNDNGDNWVVVETIEQSLTEGGTTAWQDFSFRVSEFVAPSSQVRVRFSVVDNLPGNMVEAGVDNFRLDEILCGAGCNINHCCDLDRDNIRDDACVWCECDNTPCHGLIQQIPITYADMGGENGACLPDGVADANDRFHALNCFSDQTTLGAPGYECEENAPTAFNVDAAGFEAPCTPDGVCDANDAFAAINAFGNNTSCSCGPAPSHDGRPARRTTETTTLVAEAGSGPVAPGELVEIDVYLDQPINDLRGYQLQAGVNGGSRGQLELVDIVIDADKAPVFAKQGAWTAFNLASAQVVAGLDHSGVTAPADSYLATFVYRVSDHATGRFAVEIQTDVDAGARTFLFATGEGNRISIDASLPALVQIGKSDILSKRTR